MTSHPRRQRKGDRFMAPGATANEIRCDYAVAPFDRASRDMEARWGIDRLPELVSPETAAKFGSAMAKLNAAIDSNDAEEVAARAGVAMRGLHAMDAEAKQRGHQPLPPDAWPFLARDGAACVLIRDARESALAEAAYPGATIYTLREVVNALAEYDCAVVREVKQHFPGAEVVASRPLTKTEIDLDDDIPF